MRPDAAGSHLLPDRRGQGVCRGAPRGRARLAFRFGRGSVARARSSIRRTFAASIVWAPPRRNRRAVPELRRPSRPTRRAAVPGTDDRSGRSPSRRRGQSIHARRRRRSQVAGRIRLPLRIASVAQRAEGDREGRHIEPGLLEQAHRPGHVIRRGDKQPALLRLGANQLRGEARVFVGVARRALERDPGRIDAEFDEELSRLRSFGRERGQQRTVSAGEYHPRVWILLGQNRLDQALALVEDDLASRPALRIPDAAAEHDDPMRRRHVRRRLGKAILERRDKQEADRRHRQSREQEHGPERDRAPRPRRANGGIEDGCEGDDQQQDDGRSEHPVDFRRDEEQNALPSRLRPVARGEACGKARGCLP